MELQNVQLFFGMHLALFQTKEYYIHHEIIGMGLFFYAIQH